jgi:hypothetical protein
MPVGFAHCCALPVRVSHPDQGSILEPVKDIKREPENRRKEIMPDAGATTKRADEQPFESFTDPEKKFLDDLATFLGNYPGFAGETPFERALAATFQLKLEILREGKLPPDLERTQAMCLCYDPVRHKIVLCRC